MLGSSFDMEHCIVHAFLSVLILLGSVAIATKNPNESNVVDHVPAETELPVAKHVTEEVVTVAVETMEDKLTGLAHQMNEMRKELKEDIEKFSTRIEASLKEGHSQLAEIKTRVDSLTLSVTRNIQRFRRQADNMACPTPSAGHHTGTRPSNCAEIQSQGNITSGVYVVSVSGKDIQVYCDMTTDGGGWTVLQRRMDRIPRVDFDRSWSGYKRGFGVMQGEFWLGLDNIHALTSQPMLPVRLRVDLESWGNEIVYAEYDTFRVASESDQYRLSIGGFDKRSKAGDSLTQQNAMMFTTRDRDNDGYSYKNQAAHHGGGWWHNRGSYSSLNGPYRRRGKAHKSIFWYSWKGYYALKRTEMKIRPF